MKEKLYALIQEAIGPQAATTSFVIATPEFAEQGDYSTNAALVFAKTLAKSPREVAQMIKENVENASLPELEKVEIAGPGFVNFFVSKDMLFDTVNSILEQKESFGNSQRLAGKKIITEFTDPNPFKEFHIGHLYSNSVGESISRLIESQGAQVKRVCYQGDIGLHVAKSIWGILHRREETGVTLEEIDTWHASEKAKFLGQAYALGAAAYEEDERAKQEIIDLNKKIFAKDPQILEIYEKGKTWSLAYFDSLYARLGTKFDRHFFESEVGEDGKKLVLGYLDKGVFEESDGAVIFPGKKYGLHNRVFINSLGLPTYEAKELGLAPAKEEYFFYDESVIITGNEINEYFRVLLKALEMIRPDLAEKTVHIGHGMVRLPEGKMSSRTGNVITGEWLLDEAKTRVAKKMQDSGFAVDEGGEDIAEKVGVGAVKYALLKNGIGGDIAFSFDESVSFEGNAGPYLQYTYVRTKSVLEKAGSLPSLENISVVDLSEEESAVLRNLVHFPEIVEQASKAYSPSDLCSYLYNLAQKFNLFYAKHKIVGSEQEAFRLAMTQSVGQVMANGLKLLGIPTVEKM